MISIIVPVYKIENYIRQCVDSILAQSYENIEVILVDDGSPDGCPKICDEYAAKDGRVKVVHKNNGGLMSARQAGLRAATGDYVGFVDGDDWIDADMYLTFADYIEKYHPDMLFCEFLYSYEDREEKALSIRNGRILPSSKWSRKFIRQCCSKRRITASASIRAVGLRCSKKSFLKSACIR